MIREHDEGAGKARQPLNPREMLQRMERLFSQTRSTRQKQADQAQQLVYDAWEAGTEEREHELMSQALEINPANADALLYMVNRAGLGAEEEIEALRKIVAAAGKGLGPKVFKEYAGHFWGFIKTMRGWSRWVRLWQSGTMMKGQNMQRLPGFKAKIASMAVRGTMSIKELAVRWKVNRSQVWVWKERLLQRASLAFQGRDPPGDKPHELEGSRRRQNELWMLNVLLGKIGSVA